jgi:transcriptional regulator with XRE-family HTH domain
MTIEESLKQARLRAGLSQRALARLAHTSPAAISRYESGQMSPTIRTLSRLLEACRVAAGEGRRRWPTLALLAPTMREVLIEHGSRDAWRLVGEVLDDAATESDAELRSVVEPRPEITGESRVDATVAALAEHLCVGRGMVPPPWSQETTREARPWWFVAGDPRFEAMALRESPISFARRGILVTRGALERV